VDPEKLGMIIIRALHAFDSLGMVVLGVQLFMCIYCLAVYLETSKIERSRRLPYIIFNFVVFALSAVGAFVGSELQFQREFYSSSGMDVIVDSRALASGKLTVIVMFCACFVVFLADGLMLYRCYTIRYADPLWLRVLPALLYIPSVAFGLFTISVYAKPTNGVISWPQPTFVCLTVAFNILVTVLIAQKMVASRKRLAEALPGRDMSAYTGVTAVLIESAIPLSLTGLGYAILSAMSITGPGDPYVGVTFLNLFNLLYTSFNQLSPTLIIFRVTTGRSWTNDFEQSTRESSEKGPMGTLRFHHTTQGGQDGESVVDLDGKVASSEKVEVAQVA
jgi:hypothetical protein